jgi:hypothetical protein
LFGERSPIGSHHASDANVTWIARSDGIATFGFH